ncbi:hypothetical protein Pfo_007691 [Paulownia fortunei]|nr:hypothetical protein Pfo_007691 [Paulownia fortunei]
MFRGPIDDKIGDEAVMEFVESLILSHNPLRGHIPKSLGKLSYLEELELVETGLSGEIPKELGNAKTLKTILLSDNNLSGEIPKEVLNLEYLQNFNVSGNRLGGKIPPHKPVIPVSSFARNPGLCGAPLPPCSVQLRSTKSRGMMVFPRPPDFYRVGSALRGLPDPSVDVAHRHSLRSI